MASLVELTAGIAHEIQNPLNLVNNFSEVSEELVTELKEELEKGDVEEAKNISDDVIEKAHKEIGNNLHWIKKIKKAVLEDSFVPFFQHIYNNRDRTIEKYECLIHMIDTDGKVV